MYKIVLKFLFETVHVACGYHKLSGQRHTIHLSKAVQHKVRRELNDA